MTDSEARSEIVLTLAEEFLERYRNGERPRLKEYIDRQPELADEIREVFPAMAMMEKIAIAEDSLAGNADRPATAPALEQLGDYRIIREVGRGGMGIVYEAEQVSLGRHVALKVLPHKALIDAKHKRRFEREAKSAARLHHTNIVPVFGVGEQDGLPYYVMQFIQGLGMNEVLDELIRQQGKSAVAPPREPSREVSAVDLAQSLLTGRIQGGDATVDQAIRQKTTESRSTADSSVSSGSSVVLPGQSDVQTSKKQTYWQSIANVGLQVASALDYAHNQGVLHRDIKPSNLLLDRHGTVWVTDFGLAKADDQENLTHTGDILGTLRYMPPEAFEGKTDRRGDVYAVGLTLYELLAMRPAFGERDRAKLIQQVTTMEPPRLDLLNPAIPRDLVTIVHKAIDRDPAHRYASAGELGADLRRFVDDEPIQARPISTTERLWRWSRRRPAAAAAVTFATLLLVALVALPLVVAINEANNAAELAKQITKVVEARDAEAKQTVIAVAATADALRSAKVAQAARQLAEENARAAKDNELMAKRRYYAAQMNLAARAWEEGNTPRVLDLLETQRPRHVEQDLRAFEWYALWQLCHQQLRFSQQAATGSTYAVAYSPDSSLIALGSTGGTVKLLDAASGREIRTLQGGGRSRSAVVAFSPDGKLLAQAGGPTDDQVILWNVSTGEQARVCGGAGKVSALSFSPDGKTLATGTHEGKACLWETKTSVLQQNWKTKPVLGVGFSPDGMLLATSNNWGGKEGTLLWDLNVTPPKLVREISARGNTVAFSADGNHFAVGGPAAFSLYSTDTWKEITTKKGPWGHGNSLAFIAGRDAIAVGVDRSVKVVDLKTGQAETFAHHTLVRSLAVAPDGKAVAAVGADAALKVWNLGSVGLPDVISMGSGNIFSMALSSNAQTLAVGQHKRVKVVDLTTGDAKKELTGFSQTVQTLAFFRDGKTLASGSGVWTTPGELKLWDMQSGKAPDLSPEFNAAANAIAIASDQRTLAVGGPHGDLALFDVATAKRRHLVNAYQLTALTYSPDGKLLISAGGVGKISLRHPTTGAELHTFAPNESVGFVWGLACSPNSKLLATGHQLGRIFVWDLPSGRLHAALRGNTAGVFSLGFFPDGKTLASSNEDGELKLWDIATGQERITFRMGNRLAISSDGTTLVGGWAGKVHILRASTAPEALARKSELNPDDPESPLAELDGGDRLWATGDKHEAEKAFRRAHERLQLLVDQFSEEVEYRRESVRCALSLRLLLDDRGAAADATQIWKLAKANYEKLPPDEQLALAWNAVTIGNRLRTAGSKDAAFRAYAQAIELTPHGADAKLKAIRWGLVHSFRVHAVGNYDKDPQEVEPSLRQALQLVEKLTADFPNEPAYWHYQADTQRRLGNWLASRKQLVEADKALRRAVELHDQRFAQFPKQPVNEYERRQSYFDLAAFLSVKGQEAEAEPYYSKYLEVSRHHPVAYNNAAWAWSTRPDFKAFHPDRAVAYAKKAVDLAPKAGTYWNTLGVAHYRARDWNEAITALEKSMEMRKGGDSYDWFFLAMAHWQLGKKEEARRNFDRATAWVEKNRLNLERNQQTSEELHRFRAEAEALLGTKK